MDDVTGLEGDDEVVMVVAEETISVPWKVLLFGKGMVRVFQKKLGTVGCRVILLMEFSKSA